MAALYDSTAERANEHFLNYMTSCALGEISVESGSGAGGCESAAVSQMPSSEQAVDDIIP